ncbi:MAG: outer membrane protein TolC [Lentimonas sp.]|jgi:outer membrane protein TolC
MIVRFILILIICAGTSANSHVVANEFIPEDAAVPQPLLLPEITQSVAGLYPPLLAVLIERDIAAGRLQSAKGTFDFNLFAKAFGTPVGFYESRTVETGFEKFLGLWGSTLFGGYRLTEGDELPDYYRKDRTQEGGELNLGVKVPLLQNGRIDKRRAAVMKARYDAELADPLIRRQEIDFMQASTFAYFGWLSAGTKLRLAQEQLNLARDRVEVLQTQVDNGLIKKLVITDNRRLVVDRKIQTTRARRAFEAASLVLSLFHRDDNMEPLLTGFDRLPERFPKVIDPVGLNVTNDVRLAMELRPELKQVQIKLAKAGIDLEQARNQMMPSLDASIFGSQNFGEEIYSDINEFELEAMVEFRMPLERREARGDRMVAESKQQQLLYEAQFARERISNEVQNAHSALVAAYEEIGMAEINVALAGELEGAEKEMFNQGASDFLAVQLREQSTFAAQMKSVEAIEAFFVSLTAYQAASMQF